MLGSEARKLIGKPWPLIPAKDDDQGKRCIRAWKHLQDVNANRDYDDIDAPLWAIPTGRGTGVVVLDFDGEAGHRTSHTLWEGDYRSPVRVMVSPHVRTGSGGFHLYVEAPSWPVKNRTRALPGMDVRGDGGVAYVAGSSLKGTYEILRPLVPCPLDLLPAKFQACLEPARPHSGNAAPAEYAGPGNGRMGSVAFVTREAEKVRFAAKGERNQAFNTAVFTVAGLAAAGEVDAHWARVLLTAAAEEMAPGWPGLKTVLESAWEAGSKSPWRLGAERIEG